MDWKAPSVTWNCKVYSICCFSSSCSFLCITDLPARTNYHKLHSRLFYRFFLPACKSPSRLRPNHLGDPLMQEQPSQTQVEGQQNSEDNPKTSETASSDFVLFSSNLILLKPALLVKKFHKAGISLASLNSYLFVINSRQAKGLESHQAYNTRQISKQDRVRTSLRKLAHHQKKHQQKLLENTST